MNVKRVSLMSIALVFAIVAIMTVPTYAYRMWDSDSDTGAYIHITASVAGDFYHGKLYAPAAYVRATILEDLPDNHVLVVCWRFWWVDENLVIHEQFDTEDFPSYRYKDQSVKIEPSGLPNVVYCVIAEGRAGYNAVWDTDFVLVSLPFMIE